MNHHYHGSPMWGKFVKENKGVIKCFTVLYKDSCALVSYGRPDQIKKIVPIARSLVLDNGAFKFWNDEKKGKISNVDWGEFWKGYYKWVFSLFHNIDWFIIPDVIEGTEEENDRLIENVPLVLMSKAVPVWHSVESIDRLVALCNKFPRVAIGLCGPHSATRSEAAQDRLKEAFTAIYITNKLDVKIHGLRMLDGRVLSKFPFDSADSTNVATNVPKWVQKYPYIATHILEQSKTFRDHVATDGLDNTIRELKYTYAEIQKEFNKGELLVHRTAILKNAIESVIPPTVEGWVNKQNNQTDK